MAFGPHEKNILKHLQNIFQGKLLLFLLLSSIEVAVAV